MSRQPGPDPAPFHLPGGSVGVLLIHGFTGSPPEMRMVGEYLNREGMTVSAPLLPGHGATVEEMNRCRWRDWTDHAEQALLGLSSCCEEVFVGGLSMGSLITIHLAAHHDLTGAMLYSPAVKVANPLIYLTPLVKHIIPQRSKSEEGDFADPQVDQRTWSYDAFPTSAAHELLKLIHHSREVLPRMICPLLIIHSAEDDVIQSDSAEVAFQRAGSAQKEMVTLHESGHVITVDSEWETVAETSCTFIQTHSTAGH